MGVRGKLGRVAERVKEHRVRSREERDGARGGGEDGGRGGWGAEGAPT